VEPGVSFSMLVFVWLCADVTAECVIAIVTTTAVRWCSSDWIAFRTANLFVDWGHGPLVNILWGYGPLCNFCEERTSWVLLNSWPTELLFVLLICLLTEDMDLLWISCEDMDLFVIFASKGPLEFSWIVDSTKDLCVFSRLRGFGHRKVLFRPLFSDWVCYFYFMWILWTSVFSRTTEIKSFACACDFLVTDVLIWLGVVWNLTCFSTTELLYWLTLIVGVITVRYIVNVLRMLMYLLYIYTL
jgi:hypothetical protein